MRKLYFLICTLFTVSAVWGQFSLEPFNYTPHATNGIYTQSSGDWVRINSGDSILVVSGNLSYTGLPASTGNKIAFDGTGSDNYRVFTNTAITSGTAYYSFVLNVSALGSLNTTGGYFIGLLQDASTSAFGATVWTRLSTTAGKYNIGISTRSNSTVSWLPNDLDPGTSYFVAASYEIISGTGNDVARIWLNPALGGSEPAASATGASGTDFTATGIARILIRQDAAAATPFVEIDELRAGDTWAAVTPTGSVPSLSATALTAFGNVCINTTAGPNSFTINGSNLTTANVTVGALPGFTYSTTSGGTYTASLNLTQPGGTYTQQIFVKFTPTAVQSYNGNIPVAGGGAATTVNVAASGAGINPVPTLTGGPVTGTTQNSATVGGTVTSIGCSALTSNYGVEYSTTNGFANGTGTPVTSTNIASNVFTAGLSGLAPSTTYYYHAFATNAAGTGYSTQGSFTTASLNPTITTTALTAFGNICINTTAGPNSFTISGANLTNAPVTVAALNGYTYSTTAGGTYTTTLSLTQPGGTYSQQIFVKFTPTAVQSYNGNIAVGGGGVASAVNVAATGAGVNSLATVVTGTPATSITQTSAIAPGTISSNGCSSVSAYGIEYSTVNGFANGAGTPVASTNLSGTSFTSSLSGLAPSTTYYYHAYATNGGGTAYGAQQSFTTASPTLVATTLATFGSICTNTTAGPNSFTLTGVGLTSANVTVGPLAGYTFATTANGTYSSTLTITQPGGAFNQTVYVKFNPTAVQSYDGNIPVSGGGVTTFNVAVTGSGANTTPSVTTGGASNLTNHSATLAGSITSTGCTGVNSYGIEYSGINGFANGNGTRVFGTNLAGNNFTVNLNGLVQGAVYYYKAFASNGGGMAYGAQQSFQVPAIPTGFELYPSPVSRGAEMRITMDSLIKPGYYGLQLINSAGQLVFQKDMNIQADFINQTFTIPSTLQPGIYRAYLVNFERNIGTRTILVQ